MEKKGVKNQSSDDEWFSVFISLLQVGWGLPLLLVKPVGGVRPVLGFPARGWALDAQPGATQMSWIKKTEDSKQWCPAALGRSAGLRFLTASHCVQDLPVASGPARAVGTEVVGADGDVCKCPTPCLLLLSEAGSKVRAPFSLGAANSRALPDSYPNASLNQPCLACDPVGSRCSRNKEALCSPS